VSGSHGTFCEVDVPEQRALGPHKRVCIDVQQTGVRRPGRARRIALWVRLVVVIHDGPPLSDGAVSLGSVRPDDVHGCLTDDSVRHSMGWVDRAVSDSSMIYFGIFRDQALIGQIFLHDRDEQQREALVGYHVFSAAHRGSGTGTAALRLLQRYVVEQLPLKRIIVITSTDNRPSQHLAVRCGFALAGAPTEDPDGLLYAWMVPQG
jgi:predicted acetyltransferase